MNGVGEYVVTLSAASVIVGLILAVIKDSGYEELLKLVCGVFLTIVALSPIARVEIPDFTEYSIEFNEQADAIAAVGEIYAQEARAEIIKENIQAYILDKAALMNLTLETDVTVVNEFPESVLLYGNPSPFQKSEMEKRITEDLGIAKENLKWIGRE